jgi:branched-chain amino acid transport system substrate-binding protein
MSLLTRSIFFSLLLLLSTLAGANTIKVALIEGLSGSFANAGEAVLRNLNFAVERANRDPRNLGLALELLRFDSKGQVEEANLMLRSAIDQGVTVILQGNSSAVAAALIDAIDKHNQREPARRVVYLNFSAVDPALTNERCSFWHFRFDAHADMRLSALIEGLVQNARVKKVYLLNQDYSFGQGFARSAKRLISAKRGDVQIVGDELHPLGRIRDFSAYVLRIKASGADTIVTGNWGNDLTLLVRAAKDSGLDVNFYTFYANGLGAPQAIGEAGVGKVRAVAEWHPNAESSVAAQTIFSDFKKTIREPRDDYFNMRNVVMIEMLMQALRASRAKSAVVPDALQIARQLSGMTLEGGPYTVTMRAQDHQLQTPLYVSAMQVAQGKFLKFDLEGSGLGFQTERFLDSRAVSMPHTCAMRRPE